MDHKKKNLIDKDEQAAQDEATIFADTAHIRDRDEIMQDVHRKVQGGSATDIDDEWDPSDGDRLAGTSDQSSEAVDAQLHQLERITEDVRESRDHRHPTAARPKVDDDHFEKLSDEELMKYADVLGIPERQSIPRKKLIGKIREETRSGL